MRNIQKAAAFLSLAAMLAGPIAFAQDRHDDQRDEQRDNRGEEHHDNHTYVRHEEWKKGYHMRHEDWDRGERVEYRTYHLSRPPEGYEWRLVDGNYVLAAVATGVIASVVAAAVAH
jgi:Ni/Co efflux regulator RcnB